MDITEHQINDVEGRIAFSESKGKGQRDNKMTGKIKFYTYVYQMIYILADIYTHIYVYAQMYVDVQIHTYTHMNIYIYIDIVENREPT